MSFRHWIASIVGALFFLLVTAELQEASERLDEMAARQKSQ